MSTTDPPSSTVVPPPPPESAEPTTTGDEPVHDPSHAPPSPGTERVSATNISKWFGDVVAVSDVSFTVWPGVTALLGPNGAGKSTTLRMIAGLTPPSQGRVTVLGDDPRASKEVRGRIGLVPQQERLFDEQNALDFVSLAARLNRLPNPAAAGRRALDVVQLDADDQRPIAAYSKGMRQRVKVAQAIVHEPDLLLLDEPLTGLDPRQRLHMIDVIRSIGEKACVIVSSHVLDEVERLGSRVLVIAQGRLAAQGDFHEIRDLMDDRPHRIRVRTSDSRRLGAELVRSGGVQGVSINGSEELVVDTEDVDLLRRRIAPVAKAADVALYEVQPLDDDLESVFKYLVGR